MVDIDDQARRVARMTPLDESSLTTAKSVSASIRASNAATLTAPPSSYISAFLAARVGALQHHEFLLEFLTRPVLFRETTSKISMLLGPVPLDANALRQSFLE